MKQYKKWDVCKASDAILCNRKTNYLAGEKFVQTLKENWILNNPITTGDARRSQQIFCPPIPPIKGQTRYKESPHVNDIDILQIPKHLYNDLKNVTLCINFPYANTIVTFHYISRRIDYRAVCFPLRCSKISILKELQQIYKNI